LNEIKAVQTVAALSCLKAKMLETRDSFREFMGSAKDIAARRMLKSGQGFQWLSTRVLFVLDTLNQKLGGIKFLPQQIRVLTNKSDLFSNR
jgi:hypothetical protein